jgi:hypothetical protein
LRQSLDDRSDDDEKAADYGTHAAAKYVGNVGREHENGEASETREGA